MKRLALLLGSLLVVTAAASAKEVVPAPVVVEEAPVQIIEKEVIVYRDKEEGFRPTGNVAVEYRYYGNTEGNKENKPEEGAWNKNNNYSRLETLATINMTENQTFQVRGRSYNSLSQNDESNPTAKGNKTETRLRHYYDLGTVGDSNVGMRTYAQYKHTGVSQEITTELRFDFADYLFNNDFIKTTLAEVGPSYKYSWSDRNDSDYYNAVGLYFDFYNQLPGGFAFEVVTNDDPSYYYMNGQEGSKDEFMLNLGVYLYHDVNLYTNGRYAVDWHFEGGYDTYTWASRTLDLDEKTDSKRTYSLYAQPSLILSYGVTEFITLTGTVGAEYRNWVKDNETSAQDWRWQPFVAAGFNVAF